jgi:hypothetical protein
MDDHDHRHDQRENVHEVVGALEDDGVCQLNRPGVTLCLDAGSAVYLRRRAYEGAQRYRRLLTYRGEVAETHLWRTERMSCRVDSSGCYEAEAWGGKRDRRAQQTERRGR